MEFLFWNLGGKVEAVRRLARMVDGRDMIIGLAECPATSLSELMALSGGNERFARYHQLVSYPDCGLIILGTFDRQYSRIIDASSRYVVCDIDLPDLDPFLLGVIHSQSKLRYSANDQEVFLRSFSSVIDRAEMEVGHDRTVIMGDFNVLPFESAMMMFDSLNCVLYPDVLERQGATRVFGGIKRKRFYNPMMRLAGRHPPASYHYAKAEAVQYHWHQLDQVIVRPSLADCLNDDDLKVVDHDGVESLLNDRRIPDASVSDHLPLRFVLRLPIREVVP